MITTVATARKIIRAHYGKEFDFKLTTHTQVGVRPNYELIAGRKMLAWHKLSTGDSPVKIGLCAPTGLIDWDWTNDTKS